MSNIQRGMLNMQCHQEFGCGMYTSQGVTCVTFSVFQEFDVVGLNSAFSRVLMWHVKYSAFSRVLT